MLIGENMIVLKNREFGKIEMKGIFLLFVGEVKVIILFKIDKNGILIVK